MIVPGFKSFDFNHFFYPSACYVPGFSNKIAHLPSQHIREHIGQSQSPLLRHDILVAHSSKSFFVATIFPCLQIITSSYTLVIKYHHASISSRQLSCRGYLR